MDRQLIIAGDGSERSTLEARADGCENIEFVGYVSESQKRELLSGARAFVNNALAEDFGITTAEALASGTPVIGVREGMTQFLAVDGRAGVTYERGALSAVLDRFEVNGIDWSETDIERFAERFSVDAFHAGMSDAVDEAMRRAETKPEWIDDPLPATETSGDDTTNERVLSDGGGE